MHAEVKPEVQTSNFIMVPLYKCLPNKMLQ